MLSGIFREESNRSFGPMQGRQGKYLPVNGTMHQQESSWIQSSPNLVREGTAELTNDPRFFTENVIDKRLAAFEALAIVTELMSSEAMQQCFELSKEYMFRVDMPLVATMQLIGFLLMCTVMFMSTVATAVLSLQLFFTIRLMTAGPTGFDKAARFYSDARMWAWRERAIFGVKYSLSTFTLSTGFMLFVKFYIEGMEEEGAEGEHEVVKHIKHGNLIAASGVFGLFVTMAACIMYLVWVHQRTFDDSYISVDTCVAQELRSQFALSSASP